MVLQVSICIAISSWIWKQIYSSAGSEYSDCCVGDQMEFRCNTNFAFDLAGTDVSCAQKPATLPLRSALRSSSTFSSAVVSDIAGMPNRQTSWGRRLRRPTDLGRRRSACRSSTRCPTSRATAGRCSSEASRQAIVGLGRNPCRIRSGAARMPCRLRSGVSRRPRKRCEPPPLTIAETARPSLSFGDTAEIICYRPTEADGYDHAPDQFWGSMPTKAFDGPSGHKASRKSHGRSDGGIRSGDSEPRVTWEDQCSQIISLMSCQRCTLLWSSGWE